MNHMIHVNTGEVKGGHDHAVLQSTPIGSCVVIMAWSTFRKFGIMAHVMLPGCAPEAAPIPTRYSINAIEAIADNMAPYAHLTDTGVCLIGAANVLKKADDTICNSNIHSITNHLKYKGIPVHAALLGGNQRRMACLYVHEGRMTYTEGESREKTLWQYIEKQRRNGTLKRDSTYGRRIVPVQVTGCHKN
jgi:chemotaxis receptor (MCP) glutamine deamidase CheD